MDRERARAPDIMLSTPEQIQKQWWRAMFFSASRHHRIRLEQAASLVEMGDPGNVRKEEKRITIPALARGDQPRGRLPSGDVTSLCLSTSSPRRTV